MIFLLSILIIYFNLYILLSKKLAKLENYSLGLSELKYAYSFILLIGIIGIIGNVSFYFNISIEYSIYSFYLIALILFFYLYKYRELINPVKINLKEFTLSEKILFGIIIYLICTYFYRACAPWSDTDEISQYGYRTKLIGTGFTYSDNIVKGWPQFAESAYAYFYYISKSTIIPKIFKIIGIISVSTLLYSFLKICSIPKFWCLIGTLIFLITPEFSYIASSLKTDNVLMMFEFSGLISLLLLIKFYKNINKDTVLFLCILGSFLCMLSAAVRISGIYSLIIVGISHLCILISLKEIKYLIQFIIINILVSSFILVTYWINLYEYNNPFYPLYGPWMNIFTEGQYLNGFEMSTLRDRLNIDLGNYIYEYFYVVIYSTLGFGTTLWDSIQLIIHPTDKGVSYGWANPIILSMFFLPFIAASSNMVVKTGLIYYYLLYTFWFSGIQYTRIFLASTALLIFCFICCSSQVKYKFLRFFLCYGSIVLIVLFTGYHSLYTFIRMPNSIFSLFSEEERLKSNLNYHNFIIENLKIKNERLYLDYSDVTIINDKLSKMVKPIIYTDLNAHLHMFFKYGRFVKNFDLDWNCVLVKENQDKFPDIKFSNELSRYKFACKNHENINHNSLL